MTSLAGIRVLDLSRFIAGPYCAMLLVDMGAEVVKIEPPMEGEYSRRGLPAVAGHSLHTFIVRRNKKSQAIDLRNEAGLAVLRELVAQANVLVKNFIPGTMEKMGLCWAAVHEINPRLVMARISGFGQDGPLAAKQCLDGVVQVMSGLMDLTGTEDGPPTIIDSFVCDYTTGIYTALGILAALNARHKTGIGQLVDVSLLKSAMSMLMTAIPQQMLFGAAMTRRGSRDRYVAPSNTFGAGDGRYLLMVGGDDKMSARTLRAIRKPGLAEDPHFATIADCLAHAEEFEAIVSDWLQQYSADVTVSMLKEQRVPCANVATIDEVVNNRRLLHRGQIVDIPFAGRKIPMQGVTIHLSDTPLKIRRPLPMGDEHNADVLAGWLNYGHDRLSMLREQGAL